MTIVDDILGAFEVGTFINVALFGVTFVQTTSYYDRFPTDKPVYKALVAALFFGGLVHTVASCYTIYHASVTGFGVMAELDVIPWSFLIDPVLTAVIAAPVQMFYAYRIYMLSGRSLVCPIIISFLTLAQLAIGSYTTGMGTILGKYSEVQAGPHNIAWSVGSWLGLMSASDVVITSAIVYHLEKVQSDWAETNTMLDKVIRLTVSNNAITAVTAIASAVSFAAGPGAWHVVPGLNVAKFYQVSLLASLNSRAELASSLESVRYFGTTAGGQHSFLGGTGTGHGGGSKAPSFRPATSVGSFQVHVDGDDAEELFRGVKATGASLHVGMTAPIAPRQEIHVPRRSDAPFSGMTELR